MTMGNGWKCSDGGPFNGGPCGPAPCTGECGPGPDTDTPDGPECAWCGNVWDAGPWDGDTCSDECAREAAQDRADDMRFECARDARWDD